MVLGLRFGRREWAIRGEAGCRRDRGGPGADPEDRVSGFTPIPSNPISSDRD